MQLPLCAAVVIVLLLPPAGVSAQGGPGGWSPPVSVSETPEEADDVPILICDRYQNLHLFWFGISPDDRRSFAYYRNDVRGAWSSPNSILSSPYTYNSPFGAAISSDDRIHLVWTRLDNGDLMYSSALLALAEDAHQWLEPQILAAEASPRHISGNGIIFADQQNTLHIVFGTRSGAQTSQQLNYINSSDGGRSWTEPRLVVSTQSPIPAVMFGVIKVDDAGRVHVTYEVRSDDYGAFSSVGYVRSLDQGRSWSQPLVLAHSSAAPGVAVPAVFVFGRDEIHLTWDDPTRLHQWSTDGGVTWSTPVKIASLGPAFGGFSQLAKDSSGNLHAVVAVGEGVFHTRWIGSGWGAIETIDDRKLDPHHQQLTVCRGNELHVVYRDRLGTGEIWYSTKQVDAPYLPRTSIPVPKPTAVPTPTPNPAASSPAFSLVIPEVGDQQQAQPVLSSPVGEGSEVWRPILVGIAPVVLVIALVVAGGIGRARK